MIQFQQVESPIMIPSRYAVRTYTPADARSIEAIQAEYAQVYTGAAVLPAEVYNSPSFAGGKNIFCAVNRQERVVAYAPLYPNPITDGASTLPHVIWAEIKVDPNISESHLVKDLLLPYVEDRARELVRGLPQRQAQLMFQYLPSEEPAICYVCKKGCHYVDSVYQMSRDLDDDLPDVPKPERIEVRRWKMTTWAEQCCYVQTRNQAIPHAPISLDDWRYFMTSPLWAAGTAIAAFLDDHLIGSVIVYWDEQQNQKRARPIGFTEHVFVAAPWRHQGVGAYLLVESLHHLKQHGLDEAHLEVRSHNAEAISLYESLGYRTIAQSCLFAKELCAALDSC